MSVLSEERLTDKVRNFDNTASAKNSLLNDDGSLNEYTSKVLTKLAEYEDLEEQGLILRLPCKVGDTVYQICDSFIEPCTVETIYIGNYVDGNGEYGNMAEIHYDRENCPWVSTEIYFTDFGKTVFLTQSEAEEKLRELEGAKCQN